MIKTDQPARLFLWNRRTLYLGKLSSPITLAQGSATLLVSLGGFFSFGADCNKTSKDMPKISQTNSLLIPAGKRIWIDTGDQHVANCHLDPMGEDFRLISKLMDNQSSDTYYSLNKYDAFKKLFIQLFTNRVDSDLAYQLLENVLLKERQRVFNEAHHIANAALMDQRIMQTISTIKSNIHDNLSIDDLARSVRLSVPRLMQLFKQCTGIPIRRYRLWHRLFVAGVFLGKGASLTDAALQAGFTDSSHFSNTFRDMLGMAPTTILMQENGLEIFTPPD